MKDFITFKHDDYKVEIQDKEDMKPNQLLPDLIVTKKLSLGMFEFIDESKINNEDVEDGIFLIGCDTKEGYSRRWLGKVENGRVVSKIPIYETLKED